jgi:hypothetical protein
MNDYNLTNSWSLQPAQNSDLTRSSRWLARVEFRAEHFVLRLVPHAMPDTQARGQDTLGFAIECDGAEPCPASVFYDRVSAIAKGGSAALPVLLAQAMAHELGHLLLGSHSHSRAGIIRSF